MSLNSSQSNRPLLVDAVLAAIEHLTHEEALELGIALFQEWRVTGQSSTSVAVDSLATELGLYVTERDNAYSRLHAGRKVSA